MSTAVSSPQSPTHATGRFKKAERKQLKLRMAIDGPSGSGKTYTALALAPSLGKRIAVIDTEHGSASKYVGENGWDFDALELTSFSPSEYTAAIDEAGRLGYDVIIVDSLSHAWEGKDGALEMKDRAGGNSFTAWKAITPMHRRMIESMLSSPCHVIATMRSKMEYVLEEEVGKSGKVIQVPKRIGMAPIQRQGMEYEFDIVVDMDANHIATVSKTRCRAIDGATIAKPGASFMVPILDWLATGTATPISLPPMRIRDDQLQQIAILAQACGKSNAMIEKDLAKRDYGTRSLADLTEVQASEFMSWLEGQRKLAEQKAAQSRAKEAAKANGHALSGAANGNSQAATPPANGSNGSNGSRSNGNGKPPSTNHSVDPFSAGPREEQVEAIRLLRKKLMDLPEFKSPALPEDFYAKCLAKRGVETAVKLTPELADDLIEAMKRKHQALSDAAFLAAHQSANTQASSTTNDTGAADPDPKN